LAYPNLATSEWRGKKQPFNKKITKKWLPIDAYIGGAEHAVLHLMYSRFVCMALNDWGYINFEEPFPFLFSHGLIIKDGAKMSKSRGNVVIPDEYINKYGADTLRMYLMFLGPYDQGGDFRDSGIRGMHKFIQRVWRLFLVNKASIGDKGDATLDVLLHKTVKKVGDEIGQFKYNTAIAALMEFVNAWEKKGKISYKNARNLILLFAPFAPHLSEEIWQNLEKQQLLAKKSARYRSIHLEKWPKYDLNKVKTKQAEIVVQINGKVRDRIVVGAATANKKMTVMSLAKQMPSIKKHLENQEILRVIFIPGRLLNFVVKS
jgi:leucyl-tRNA synthetase